MKLLTNCCDRVFYEFGKVGEYPYTNFTVELVEVIDGKYAYELEVNVMDLGDSRTLVDSIADDIQNTFDHLYFANQNISFTSYLGKRNTVTEENKNIKRNRLAFWLDLYFL